MTQNYTATAARSVSVPAPCAFGASAARWYPSSGRPLEAAVVLFGAETTTDATTAGHA